MNPYSKLLSSTLVSAALLLSANQAFAETSVADQGVGANIACAGGSIAAHIEDILFTISAPLVAKPQGGAPAQTRAATLLNYPLKTELTVRRANNPDDVDDIRGQVLTALGAIYALDEPATLNTALANRKRIKILNVSYSTVCQQL